MPDIGQFSTPESVRLLFDVRQDPMRALQHSTLGWRRFGCFFGCCDGETTRRPRISRGVYTRLPFGANQSPVEYMAYFGSPLHYMLVHELRERHVPGCVCLWVDDFFWCWTNLPAHDGE